MTGLRGGEWAVTALVLASMFGVSHAAFSLQADDKYAWLYAVGRNGTLLKSSNCGGTWFDMTKQTGTTEDLMVVDFFNARSGYAVGKNGTIIYTTDVGIKWDAVDFVKGENEEQSNPTPRLDFAGLYVQGFPGPVMMVGDRGLFARSLDAAVWTVDAIWCHGLECQAQPYSATTPPQPGYVRLGRLRELRFKDANTGVIIGDNGVVLLTQDGANPQPTFKAVDLFGGMARPWPDMIALDMNKLGNMIAVGRKGIVMSIRFKGNPDDDKVEFIFRGCNKVDGCTSVPPFKLNTGKGGSSITDSDLWAGNTIALNGPGKKNYHVISGSNGFIALYDESVEPHVWRFPNPPVGWQTGETFISLYCSTPITHVIVSDRGNIYRTQSGGESYTKIAIGDGKYAFTSISGRNSADQSGASQMSSFFSLSARALLAVATICFPLAIIDVCN